MNEPLLSLPSFILNNINFLLLFYIFKDRFVFRLIVIAEKDDVYQRFPIPLINRLEKHLLVMSTGLTQHQNYLVKELKNWIIRFSTLTTENSSQERYVAYYEKIFLSKKVRMSTFLDVIEIHFFDINYHFAWNLRFP